MAPKIPRPKIEFKMSKKNRIALLVLLIVALLAGGGYLGYLKFLEHTKKTEVLQAMRMKYGAQFKVLSIKELDELNYNAYLTATAIDDSVITVKMKDGSTKTEDNYVSVRLCHELTDKVSEKLEKNEYLYVHTDNALEETDAGEHDPGTITEAEYLDAHKNDHFDVSIFVDAGKVKPKTLRNTLGSMAYSIDTMRGNFRVYSLNHESYEELTKTIRKYDSCTRKEIKAAIDKEAEEILTLSFEEINPPKEEKEKKAAEKKDEKKESTKDTAKDKENVKDQDNG